MTHLEHWLKDYWFHLDGTPCPEQMAPSEKTAGGQYWWCSEHQKQLVYSPPADLQERAMIARVERVVQAITKPLFVYRMARAKLHNRGPVSKGAHSSFMTAVSEIDAALKREYGK